MVEEMLARHMRELRDRARWANKIGRTFSDQIRRRAPSCGDKWHLDEVVFPSPAKLTRSGARSISTALFSTFWSRNGETAERRSDETPEKRR